jgi:hypothetical protein
MSEQAVAHDDEDSGAGCAAEVDLKRERESQLAVLSSMLPDDDCPFIDSDVAGWEVVQSSAAAEARKRKIEQRRQERAGKRAKQRVAKLAEKHEEGEGAGSSVGTTEPSHSKKRSRAATKDEEHRPAAVEVDVKTDFKSMFAQAWKGSYEQSSSFKLFDTADAADSAPSEAAPSEAAPFKLFGDADARADAAAKDRTVQRPPAAPAKPAPARADWIAATLRVTKEARVATARDPSAEKPRAPTKPDASAAFSFMRTESEYAHARRRAFAYAGVR